MGKQFNAQAFLDKVGFIPEIGCILGSSWGIVGDFLTDKTFVPYSKIDGMPTCSVQGHKGGFSFGRLFGKNVVLAEGRLHLYEGHDAATVVKPIEFMREAGADKLLITNAAGGIRPDFKPGDFMAIRDHINLTCQNPLIGNSHMGNNRFVDMTSAYDSALLEAMLSLSNNDITVHSGIYAQLLGPSFETPAEIAFLRTIGADAVGMSTAVEVISARSLQMRVAAISCITNLAAGLSHSLSHDEVLDVSNQASDRIYRLLAAFIPLM